MPDPSRSVRKSEKETNFWWCVCVSSFFPERYKRCSFLDNHILFICGLLCIRTLRAGTERYTFRRCGFEPPWSITSISESTTQRVPRTPRLPGARANKASAPLAGLNSKSLALHCDVIVIGFFICHIIFCKAKQ